MKLIYSFLVLYLFLAGCTLAQVNTDHGQEKESLSSAIVQHLASLSKKVNSIQEELQMCTSEHLTTQSMVLLLHDQIKSMEKAIQGLEVKPCNCLDLLRKGITKSGVYTVYFGGKAVDVYCDMETDGGGWLVFQRRTDGSENFYRGWDDYKTGFGNFTNEFWLGNDNLYKILNNCGNQYELRVDLEDFNNETRYAKYSTFNIGNSLDNYRLQIGGFSGDAGDSLDIHNGYKFSTFDKDNDEHKNKCAVTFKGAWWYEACHSSNLNGLYLRGSHTSYADGVEWYHWKGYHNSLKFTEMKIRPKQCK